MPSSAILCLERLFREGWSLGVAPAVHTESSLKVFIAEDLVECKPYLQCLLRLTELLCSGVAPGGVRPRESVGYHHKLL